MLSAAIFVAGLAAVLAEGYGPRCFDCNYAPSGYSYHVNYWKRVSSDAGFEGCALTGKDDAEKLDKWHCSSGTCFIRRDKNGLVYRGCANPENLPLGVSAYRQCAYQGESFYYFCKGDLCNSGQLGEHGVCGYKPAYYGHYNPCDGKCAYNPSGLFADHYNRNGFIQCGCDNKDGETCSCCKPFYMRCPYGTAFDDSTKVCSKAAYDPHYVPAPYHPAPHHHNVHVPHHNVHVPHHGY